jgi:hypothetical protein
MIGSFAGAIVSGSLLGLIIGIVAPIAPGDPGTANTVSSRTQPPSAGPATPAAPSAAPSPVKTTFKPVRTTTLMALPVPQGFIEHPENDHTMFPATLEAMNSGDHNRVLIYVRRADLIGGAVVARPGTQPEELVLRYDAAFWGVLVLGDHQNINRQRLGFDQFLGVAGAVLAGNEHPPVWIKRTSGPAAGPVIYLAEHQRLA